MHDERLELAIIAAIFFPSLLLTFICVLLVEARGGCAVDFFDHLEHNPSWVTDAAFLAASPIGWFYTLQIFV